MEKPVFVQSLRFKVQSLRFKVQSLGGKQAQSRETLRSGVCSKFKVEPTLKSRF